MTILVSAPNDLATTVHDRMPVFVAPTDRDRWLDSTLTASDCIAPLLGPDAGPIPACPIGRRVNDPKNESPALILPALDRGA